MRAASKRFTYDGDKDKNEARTMSDRLGDVDGFRTSVESLPDRDVMLRTRGGEPEVTTRFKRQKIPQLVEVAFKKRRYFTKLSLTAATALELVSDPEESLLSVSRIVLYVKSFFMSGVGRLRSRLPREVRSDTPIEDTDKDLYVPTAIRSSDAVLSFFDFQPKGFSAGDLRASANKAGPDETTLPVSPEKFISRKLYDTVLCTAPTHPWLCFSVKPVKTATVLLGSGEVVRARFKNYDPDDIDGAEYCGQSVMNHCTLDYVRTFGQPWHGEMDAVTGILTLEDGVATKQGFLPSGLRPPGVLPLVGLLRQRTDAATRNAVFPVALNWPETPAYDETFAAYKFATNTWVVGEMPVPVNIFLGASRLVDFSAQLTASLVPPVDAVETTAKALWKDYLILNGSQYQAGPLDSSEGRASSNLGPESWLYRAPDGTVFKLWASLGNIDSCEIRATPVDAGLLPDDIAAEEVAQGGRYWADGAVVFSNRAPGNEPYLNINYGHCERLSASKDGASAVLAAIAPQGGSLVYRRFTVTGGSATSCPTVTSTLVTVTPESTMVQLVGAKPGSSVGMLRSPLWAWMTPDGDVVVFKWKLVVTGTAYTGTYMTDQGVVYTPTSSEMRPPIAETVEASIEWGDNSWPVYKKTVSRAWGDYYSFDGTSGNVTVTKWGQDLTEIETLSVPETFTTTTTYTASTGASAYSYSGVKENASDNRSWYLSGGYSGGLVAIQRSGRSWWVFGALCDTPVVVEEDDTTIVMNPKTGELLINKWPW